MEKSENSPTEANSEKSKMRQDVVAWFISILFIIGLLGAMWGWGIAVGWNAISGYYYDDVENTQSRLLPEPYYCNETNIPGRSGAECSSTWYFWKLPPDDVTTLSRAVVWVLYCTHQVFVWGLIYRAQLIVSLRSKETKQRKYDTRLRWFNWLLLAVNGVFHVLHLVQSHWTYDATAQDVAISSSQGSVIMMLCFILLMEYKDRGIVMMWPNPRSDDKVAKYLRLNPGPIQLIRKYHGFAFAWASIYTFWYHPMENTWGHTLGFFHTAIVLLQGSLIYTDMHLNRYWRLLNEAWVLLHGTLVAVQTGNPSESATSIWPIFGFGFGLILAFTQVFSLPFWKRISAWFRIIPIIIYFGIVIALCGTIVQGKDGQSGYSRMYEMFFIPAEEYMMFFFGWLVIYIFIRIEAAITKNRTINNEVSATKQAVYLSVIVLIYALFILVSYLLRTVTGSLITWMIIFVFIFSFGVCVSVMLFKQLMGPFRKLARPSSVNANIQTMSNSLETASTSSQSVGTENNAYVSEKF